MDWNSGLMLLLAFGLVILNGFFVAAEFALVKVRISQLESMVAKGRPFAKSARWLAGRLDLSLAACQLGITMASLALGWVGEPAFATLIEPVFHWLGVESKQLLHIFAFIFAFSVITTLHLVVGEQAPKIFAIRKPGKMILWCAAPMVFFFYLLYPFVVILNWITSIILGWLGLKGGGGHDSPHNEQEIRALMEEAHVHGHLTGAEHRLLNAVFEFDDLICRLVMVPRGEVDVLDVNQPFPDLLNYARETKHTRYPVCDGSLDNLLGVLHMKDLLGIQPDDQNFDVRSIMRKPVKVPENMPISRVLQRIQNSHQLLTFVVDEYGTIIGVVTLENILEKIIGPVDDEFDIADDPEIQQLSDTEFMIYGATPIVEAERALGLNLDNDDVDTVAGVLMTRAAKIPEKGDQVKFDGALAIVVEVQHDHAEKIRFVLDKPKVEIEDEDF